MALITHLLRNAVTRLVETPQRTLSRVSSRFSALPVQPPPSIPPPHVVSRLEEAFEALSDLPLLPDVPSALELACDTLEGELPAEAVAAGLHDIDDDAIRFVVARGLGERLRGTTLPRARCLTEYAAEQAIIVRGGAAGVDWIGDNGAESTILLCPIVHDTTLSGMLALADPVCSAEFSRYDLELVRYVADQLAAFIHEQGRRPRPARAAASRSGVRP